MKKIILYGVRHVELRREIEYFLDDGDEIVGYSDGHYSSDILDGKRFIPPEQLANTEFDYILPLSFKEEILEEMRADIIDRGVPPEKIVRPIMFLRQGAEKMQPDLIADIEARYRGEEGLIFGLSYSFGGILEKKLKSAFYDCSWRGMDLYYNYRIFQYMRRRGLLAGVKTALLVFPYYYFNYDMSRSMFQYNSGHIFALRRFDDWHNYRQTPGASEYVANYRMFGRKISGFYHAPKCKRKDRMIWQGQPGEADIKKAWTWDRPETTAENTALFADFCRELTETGIAPVFVVPPNYVNGFNRDSMEFVRKRKFEFYRIMEIEGVDIFDFFDAFANRRDFFRDLYHLNYEGAEAFTELINQTVLQKRG